MAGGGVASGPEQANGDSILMAVPGSSRAAPLHRSGPIWKAASQAHRYNLED